MMYCIKSLFMDVIKKSYNFCPWLYGRPNVLLPCACAANSNASGYLQVFEKTVITISEQTMKYL